MTESNTPPPVPSPGSGAQSGTDVSMASQGDERRWRKKPVVIEAMEYTYATRAAVIAWCGAGHQSTDDDGAIYETDALRIATLEGVMHAIPGDWIICGVKGEFYPCKPDIFAATYEPASSARPTPPEAEKDEDVLIVNVMNASRAGGFMRGQRLDDEAANKDEDHAVAALRMRVKRLRAESTYANTKRALASEDAASEAPKDAETLSRLRTLAGTLAPLVAKATPGPWEVEDDEDGAHVIRMGGAIESRGSYQPQHVITYEHGLYADDEAPKVRAQFDEAAANAELIVSLKNDAVPLLLALAPTNEKTQ